jgi:sulfite reductase (NADPH) flavoprotein alpha-component
MVRAAESTASFELDHAELGTPALSVLYGSQTGNAEFLASQIADQANAQGYAAELMSLELLTVEEAARKDRLLIVTATHDNGHMPDNAQAFWDGLGRADTPLFKGVPFAVLAIGDSMYDDFCKAGIDLDQRIGDLGGRRMSDRIDCDVDYDLTSGKWISSVLEKFKTVAPRQHASDAPAASASNTQRSEPAKVMRKEPDTATIAAARLLCAPGAEKEVWHYELEVSGDSRHYRPGDSLAVIPTNSAQLVDDLISSLNLQGSEVFNGQSKPVKEVLLNDLELRLPHLGLVAWLAEPLAAEHPVKKLVESGDRAALEDWLWGRDVVDVIAETCAGNLDPQEFMSMLRPLQHRSYSIASSPLADGERVHLTVSSVKYDARDRKHTGACSGFLEEAARSNMQFKVFPLPAHEFHLPENASTDVIMVGPGVGIAPFRGFLRDRDSSRAQGRNWLFFGDRHEKPLWLYQEEIESALNDGVLNRLSLAFSRDQAAKVYVQDRIREDGTELFAWLKAGAAVYVCGDKRMSPDIDDALIAVLCEHGGMSQESAHEYVLAMKNDGRYVKDVY